MRHSGFQNLIIAIIIYLWLYRYGALWFPKPEINNGIDMQELLDAGEALFYLSPPFLCISSSTFVFFVLSLFLFSFPSFLQLITGCVVYSAIPDAHVLFSGILLLSPRCFILNFPLRSLLPFPIS